MRNPQRQMVDQSSTRHARHAALVDLLEPRLMMTSISGSVYNDLNGNGHRDAGEQGLSGWVVYETGYTNGALTASSLRTVTDATGSYRLTYNFFSLRGGQAHIRVATPAGWQLTEPSAGEYVTPLSGVMNVYSGKNFGNQAIPGVVAPPAAPNATVAVAASDPITHLLSAGIHGRKSNGHHEGPV